MTTTASLSVGINTDEAFASLKKLRLEMQNQPHKLLISVDASSVDRDIQRYLAQRSFSINVDTRALGARLKSDLNKTFKEVMETTHQIKVDTLGLTERISAAVTAGMAGASVKLGAVGAATPGAAPALNPGTQASLIRGLNQILQPALDEMSKAAMAIASTAKATGISRQAGSPSASTSQSMKNLDGSTARSALDTENLKKSISGLTPSIDSSKEAHKRLAGAMNDGHAAARGLAGSMGALWATYGSVVPLLAFAAVGAGLRAIYEDGKKVEYQLAFIKGLGGASLSQKEVERATAGSMASPTQALEGLRALTQSGLSTKEALAALPDVLSLATVGETSVGDAAYAATGVLKAFGLGISEVGRVSDVMAKSAAVSNASVQDMMAAFKYASAASSMYGVSLEETGAALAMLAEKNIKGSMAGTAHMNLLKEIYTPTKKAAEAFKSVGLDMQEMQRQGLGSIGMIDKIREATSRLDPTSLRAFAAAIGGERGQRELAPLLAGGTKSLAEMQRTLEGAKGFTQSIMMELQNTVEGSSARMKQAITFAFSGAFENGKGSIQAFNDTLANAFGNPAFKSYVDSMAQGMVGVTRFLVDHAEAIKNVTLAYVALKGASVVVTLMSEVAQAMARGTIAIEAKIAVTRASTITSEVDTLATRVRTQAEHAHNIALEQAILLEMGKRGAVALGAAATTGAAAITAAGAVAQVGAMASIGSAATLAGRAATGLSLGVSGLARGLSFLAGPVGIVIGLVLTLGTLWEVLTAKQGGARDAQDAYTNSVNNTNRILDQEIERLKLKKYLLDHPGTSESQATVKLQVSRQSDYINQVEAAYKKDVESGSSKRTYGARGQGIMPTYEITNVDGTTRSVGSGAELKALKEALDKTTGSKKNNDLVLSARDQLTSMIKRSGVIAAETSVIDQRNAQNEFKAWIDLSVDELEGRKATYKKDAAKTSEIDNAIKLLKDRKNPDYLEGIKDSRSAQGIEKNLKDQVIDPTGTKWSIPEKPKKLDRSEDLARSNAAIAELQRSMNLTKEGIKFARELDQARYGSNRFGPYLAAKEAELQSERDLLDIEAERVSVLKGFDAQIAKFSGANRINLESRKEAAKSDLDGQVRRSQQNVVLAKVRSGNAATDERGKDDNELRTLADQSQKQLQEIYAKYSVKTLSRTEAAEMEARLKTEDIFRSAISKSVQEVEIAQRNVNNLQAESAGWTGNLKAGAVALVDELKKQESAEQRVLDKLREQEGLQADRAGKAAALSQAASETPEAGWNKFWKEYVGQGQSAAKEVEDSLKRATDGMSSALLDFVTKGKVDFRSLISSLLAEELKARSSGMFKSVLGAMGFGGKKGPESPQASFRATELLAQKAAETASTTAMVATTEIQTLAVKTSTASIFEMGTAAKLAALALSQISGGGSASGLSGILGLFTGGGQSGNGNAGITVGDQVFNNPSAFVPMAHGGIMTPYGAMPLRKYASGGIARGPQFSVHGEGSLPEANVPLQDGRTIPVTLKGDTGGGRPSVNLSYSPVIQIDSRTDQAQVAELVGRAVNEGNRQMMQHLRDTGALA